MKEITRIHLAQTPYNIEVAAKKELEKYLNAVAKALGADDDALREIEARIIELLMERGVTGDKVITSSDVAAIEERLGKPGDFADEEVSPVASSKRLMRDTEGGMIGGVLSGFAAYTGIDVVWWRVAMVILAFASFGTVVLLYVVLWIVMPKATTAAERLQMRGVVPSLENIHEEAAREIIDVPTKRKPLVMVLRVFGAVAFAVAAIGAVALVAAVSFGVSPLWFDYGQLVNGWLIAAFVLCVASGLLFAVLMAIAAYAIGAWRITKSLVVIANAIIVVGLVSFGSAVGVAFQGSTVLHADIEQHTKKTRTDLPQLIGAKHVKMNIPFGARYVVTDQQPYVSVEQLQAGGSHEAHFTAVQEGDVVTLKVEGSTDMPCNNMLRRCWGNSAPKVTVYGPALDELTVKGVGMRYETTAQSSLRLTVQQNSSVALDGSINTLEASVQQNGDLSAHMAAIDSAKLSLDQGAAVGLGVLRDINVIVPDSCGAAIEGHVKYARAGQVTVNGKAWSAEGENACIRIGKNEEY